MNTTDYYVSVLSFIFIVVLGSLQQPCKAVSVTRSNYIGELDSEVCQFGIQKLQQPSLRLELKTIPYNFQLHWNRTIGCGCGSIIEYQDIINETEHGDWRHVITQCYKSWQYNAQWDGCTLGRYRVKLTNRRENSTYSNTVRLRDHLNITSANLGKIERISDLWDQKEVSEKWFGDDDILRNNRRGIMVAKLDIAYISLFPADVDAWYLESMQYICLPTAETGSLRTPSDVKIVRRKIPYELLLWIPYDNHGCAVHYRLKGQSVCGAEDYTPADIVINLQNCNNFEDVDMCKETLAIVPVAAVNVTWAEPPQMKFEVRWQPVDNVTFYALQWGTLEDGVMREENCTVQRSTDARITCETCDMESTFALRVIGLKGWGETRQLTPDCVEGVFWAGVDISFSGKISDLPRPAEQEESLAAKLNMPPWAFFTLLGAIGLLCIISAGLLVHTYRKRTAPRIAHLERVLSNVATVTEMVAINKLAAIANSPPDQWEIDHDQLVITGTLGSGAFGLVQLGKLMMLEGEMEVAVKRLQQDTEDYFVTADFLAEINLMKQLDTHPNVVNMLACCTRREPICVVVEHAEHGDLLHFLRVQRQNMKEQERRAAALRRERRRSRSQSQSSASDSVLGRTSSGDSDIVRVKVGRKSAGQSVSNVIHTVLEHRCKDEECDEGFVCGHEEVFRTSGEQLQHQEDELQARVQGQRQSAGEFESRERRHVHQTENVDRLHRPSLAYRESLTGMSLSRKYSSCLSSDCQADFSDDDDELDNEYNDPREIYKTMSEDYMQCMGFTQKQMLSFTRDIANGMEFLATRGFVHRDLAARNVLVDSRLNCKIGDFGLARYVIADDVYVARVGGKLPIKWMSPEAIFDLTFSSSSDVWSFGIVMYEVHTLGAAPYPGLSNKEVVRLLRKKYRMERPPTISQEIFDRMQQCWSEYAEDRPSFSELAQIAEEMMQEEETVEEITPSNFTSEYYCRVTQDSTPTPPTEGMELPRRLSSVSTDLSEGAASDMERKMRTASRASMKGNIDSGVSTKDHSDIGFTRKEKRDSGVSTKDHSDSGVDSEAARRDDSSIEDSEIFI